MDVSREQLESLHKNMQELLDNANKQEIKTGENIRTTNGVLLVFTFLGAFLTGSIFYMFFDLTKAINHSIHSMSAIKLQVAELRSSMSGITSSVKNMGRDVEVLYYMNESVGHMAQETGIINSYIAQLSEQSRLLSVDVSYVRHHVDQVNQNFSSINQAMGGVSHSLYETAKPVKQFIPFP
jgi:methyl-accepting chemotaxis protein